MTQTQFYATGRRKSSTARVFMRRGTGNIVINERNLDNYFGRETARMIVMQPLDTVNEKGKFDFYITVTGGGVSGQAGAIRLGIARALVAYDEEGATGTDSGDSGAGVLSFRKLLREKGLLTRDARVV